MNNGTNMIGKILDNKYEIISLVGQGGMAMVYKARDLRLDRFVAIKILKNEYIDNEQFLKKFLREAQADAKLAHPNIVNVYDVGAQNGMYYIVMEYIDGKTLSDYIKMTKKMDPEEVINMIYAISAGLNHAHSNNIIHRDIKPHNILLTTSKAPKVADFGIARATTSSTLTATEDALGSVHYISPEQARGGFLDERSDLYSLGIMMFQMLTGELPYDGETPVTVALKHVQNNVESPQTLNKDIPSGVSQVVLNLTRRKPEERYQNVKQLMDDLRKLREDINEEIKPTYEVKKPADKKQAAGKPSFYKKGKKLTKKQRLLAVALAAIVLTAIVIIVISVLPPRTVSVPSVADLSQEDAIKMLEDNYLTYEVRTESSIDVAEGFVIRQVPGEGSVVDRNTTIRIFVSTGPKMITVPDFTDSVEREAISALEALGFVYSKSEYDFNDEYARGTVYSQSPKPGTVAPEGSGIILYVSNGKDVVTVPNIVNMSVSAAKNELQPLGLSVGNITYATSDKIAKDNIISQTPSAYKEIERNKSVDIVVSLGAPKTKEIIINTSRYLTVPADPAQTYLFEIKTKTLNSSTEVSVYKGTHTRDYEMKFNISGAQNDVVDVNVYLDGILVETFTEILR